MTDNDAAKALDALNSIELSSCEVWDQTVDIYDLVDKDTIETIRAALVKSAKVGGLLDDLEIIKKECMSVEAMKTPARSLGSILFTINEAIQKYKGMSND